MANTLNRLYPLPVATRTVRQEIESLQQQVLPMLDNDIHELFTAIADLAAADHRHEIADITGLVDALADKMPGDQLFALADLQGVVGTSEAPDGYVLVKVGEEWVAQAAVSALSGSNVLFGDGNLAEVEDQDIARNNLKAVGYEVATVTDADALFQPGNYIAGTTWVGSPVAGTSTANQGYLAVQRLGGPANVLQVLTASAGSQAILMRRRVASVWEAWRPVMLGTNKITSAAPSGGVDGDTWDQIDA